MTPETINIIKNFGQINQSLVFRKGNVIRTISESLNVMAKATVDDVFPFEFGIYDVKDMVDVLSLAKDGVAEYHDNHLTFQNSESSVNYYYTNIELLTEPPAKDVVMPNPEVEFLLDQDTFIKLKKASSTLKHKIIDISGGSDYVRLSILDLQNPTSNSFYIDVDGSFDYEGDKKLRLNIDNLKLIPDNYVVEVSSKLISKFESNTTDLVYWVALEKN